MSAQQILLDPVDFMALHLSSLVHGGVGVARWFDGAGCPLCIHGHAQFLEGLAPYGPGRGDSALEGRLDKAGLTIDVNDDKIPQGVAVGERVPFTKYAALYVNIDIKEVA